MSSIRFNFSVASIYSLVVIFRQLLQRLTELGQEYSQKYGLLYKFSHIFIRQQKDWDCGVACCAMALKWCMKNPDLVYEHEIAFRGRPLWTIDLFFFLYQNAMNVTMYTTYIGCHSHHHQTYEWYQSHLDDDQSHLVGQFEHAKSRDLPIYQMELSLSHLKRILSDEQEKIVIILVDNLTLHGNPEGGEKFVGHYILLLRYDYNYDTFYYFNPGSQQGILKVPSHLLEAARIHPGTDQDLIICNK